MGRRYSSHSQYRGARYSPTYFPRRPLRPFGREFHGTNPRFRGSAERSGGDRKVFSDKEASVGWTDNLPLRTKMNTKSPTPIVSIASIFKTKPSRDRSKEPDQLPRVRKVKGLVYLPTCSHRRESTVHFFPEMFSLPSFSFDMVYYQKLALVLKGKGKINLRQYPHHQSD